MDDHPLRRNGALSRAGDSGGYVSAPAELRIAHSSVSRMAHLEGHREWLESVLGCELSEALIFEFEPPVTRFALAELLRGVPLYRKDVDASTPADNAE